MIVLAAMMGCGILGGAIGFWLGRMWGFCAGLDWLELNLGIKKAPH